MSVFELLQKAHSLTNGLNNVLKKFGLYTAQFQILLCLDENGAMKLTQLKKYMNVQTPTTTRTVKRLIELGWVTSIPGEDHREKIIQLTDQASKELPEIKKAVKRFELDIINRLSKDELVQLPRLLRKLTL